MGQYDDVIFRLAVDSRPYERSLINAVHSAFSFAGKVSAALSQPGKTLSQLGHTIGK